MKTEGMEINRTVRLAILTPATWSSSRDLSPIHRARHFYVPGVDDIAAVTMVLDSFIQESIGAISTAQARTFVFRHGVPKELVSDSLFYLTHSFWYSMLCAVRNLPSWRDETSQKLCPSVEFYAPFGFCCDYCRNMVGVVAPNKSPFVRANYPPFHFGCKLDVKNVTKKLAIEQFCIQPQHAEYFFNPLDFTEAWDGPVWEVG